MSPRKPKEITNLAKSDWHICIFFHDQYFTLHLVKITKTPYLEISPGTKLVIESFNFRGKKPTKSWEGTAGQINQKDETITIRGQKPLQILRVEGLVSETGNSIFVLATRKILTRDGIIDRTPARREIRFTGDKL